jgi:hypothetical protein
MGMPALPNSLSRCCGVGVYTVEISMTSVVLLCWIHFCSKITFPMLSVFGHCRLISSPPGVVRQVAKCISLKSCPGYPGISPKWYGNSFCGRPRSWTRLPNVSRSDRRPPGVRLADAILGRDPASLLKAGGDSKIAEELRKEIFEELDLELPQMKEATYSSSEEYHSALRKLVVEETWFSIVEALKSFQSKDRQQLQNDGVEVRVMGDPSESPWFEALSYQPFSRWNQKNLRAGSVIAIVPHGEEYTEETIMFGVVKQGSEKSQKCKLMFFVRVDW